MPPAILVCTRRDFRSLGDFGSLIPGKPSGALLRPVYGLVLAQEVLSPHAVGIAATFPFRRLEGVQVPCVHEWWARWSQVPCCCSAGSSSPGRRSPRKRRKN